MTAAEKHQVKERFPEMPNIFTLREFTGQEGDIVEPLGGTLADYGACYEHIDLLTKVAAEIIFKEETENDSVGTVSYTHLDVYKRQCRFCAEAVRTKGRADSLDLIGSN